MKDLHRKEAKQQQQVRATKGRKKAAAAAAPMAASSELLLLQHRLQCCMLLLENCLSLSAGHFQTFAGLSVKTAAGEPSESAMQLLLDCMLDALPQLEYRQNAPPRASPSPSPLLLPSDAHSISTLLCILRILCNATNRNETGIASLNANYRVEGQEVSWLLLPFALRANLAARY